MVRVLRNGAGGPVAARRPPALGHVATLEPAVSPYSDLLKRCLTRLVLPLSAERMRRLGRPTTIRH